MDIHTMCQGRHDVLCQCCYVAMLVSGGWAARRGVRIDVFIVHAAADAKHAA